MNALEVEHLHVTAGTATLVKDASLVLPRGATAAIVGPSGSGKSVLLRALCGLHPSTGDVVVDGKRSSVEGWPAARGNLGVLLGTPGLLDDLDVLGNVTWRLRRQGVSPSESDARGMEVLADVGLADAAHKFPGQLSGGMQRRAALARALIHRPPCLMLDDPTAGLDPITSAGVMDLILHMAQRHETAVLLTTHDLWRVASRVEQVWILRAGVLTRAAGDADAWTAELAA